MVVAASVSSSLVYAHPLANTYVWTSEDHKNRARMWEIAEYIALFAAASFIVVTAVFCFYSPFFYTFLTTNIEGMVFLSSLVGMVTFSFFKFLNDKCIEHSIECTTKEIAENREHDAEAYRKQVNTSGANRLEYLKAYYAACEESHQKKIDDWTNKHKATTNFDEKINFFVKRIRSDLSFRMAKIGKIFIQYVIDHPSFALPSNELYTFIKNDRTPLQTLAVHLLYHNVLTENSPEKTQSGAFVKFINHTDPNKSQYYSVCFQEIDELGVTQMIDTAAASFV